MIKFCGYDWITEERWGQIHPEKPDWELPCERRLELLPVPAQEKGPMIHSHRNSFSSTQDTIRLNAENRL